MLLNMQYYQICYITYYMEVINN